jgi:ABC-2 type transport system permease protein
VLMLILGAVIGAGEYRHGTIASTLLATPDRLRAVGGQAAACGLGGLVVGIAAAALVAVIVLPVLSGRDAPLPDTTTTLRVMLGTVLFSGLAAALGVAIGAAMRNQVAAIVTLLLIFFVVDGVISSFAEEYFRFSLSGLSSAIGGDTEDQAGFELLPQGVAAAVWAGYTLAVLGLAAFLTSRRDI